LPKRAEYDHVAVYQILDEGFICHVAFAHDGKPVVIPTSYARIGDYLYIHGSAASRMSGRWRRGLTFALR
jgi:nitroimidazol reductase NimA-like FMN-containing flavoprotein (pyridoxamine 5'-phosphate oxidase superfamily)